MSLVATASALKIAGVRHGFFGRTGAADDRAAATAALKAERLFNPKQVHSAQAVVAPWRGAPPEADAVVTDRPGLAVGVVTADCAPILMADVDAGVVAAVHAGWRGGLAGVVEAAVARMAALGARPERIIAAIGPAISQAAYEVGPEFAARFLADDPANEAFFVPSAGDRLQFDLKGYVLKRLKRAGVADAEALPHCTVGEEAALHSYRRAAKSGLEDTGRNISAIVLGADDH